jgi:phosphonate transport system substrate-binding protein
MRRLRWLAPLALLAGLAWGCAPEERPRRVLRVGFVPAENMERVAQNAQPLVALMQRRLELEVQPFVATDYTGVVEALRADKLDVAFLTPASYVLARQEARVRVLLKSHRRGRPFYYAAIITHADSGISRLEQLRDRKFAFTDPLSTSGHVFPRKMFKERGIDPERDFRSVIFSGGHDATVLAVLYRKVDGGATFANTPDGKDAAWLQYLKDPREQRQIRAIAYSEPIPADNLVVNESVDPELARKIERIFVELSGEPSGQKMLRELYQIDGFVAASDRDYEPVREAFAIAGINLKEALKRKAR